MAHGPSCSAACGIFLDQGSSPCPLHWQADSQPLRHQGSPTNTFISSSNSVCVSCGCCNKLPQTRRLKTTEIHSLTLMKGRSLKSVPLAGKQGVGRMVAPEEALGENLFLVSSSSWWPVAFLDLCPHHSSLCLRGHIAGSSSV